MSLDFRGLNGELLERGAPPTEFGSAPSYTDELLHVLNLGEYHRDDLIYRVDASSEFYDADAAAVAATKRHEAVEKALLRGKTLHDRISRGSEVALHESIRNDEIIRHFLTMTMQYAQTSADIKFVDEVMDITLAAHDEMQPTYTYITPVGVDKLEDNALASRYLELMLGQNDTFEDWQPIVDWGALALTGGVEKLDEWSGHNQDIVTMKAWRERFAGSRVGNMVDRQLDTIDTMSTYPTLFKLPGVRFADQVDLVEVNFRYPKYSKELPVL